jgi:hypothetical protein
MVDNSSKPPIWLPESMIRLSYAEYGKEQLLGAIKVRAQNLGSVPKIETAIERAKRLQQDSLLRDERKRLISEQGMNAFYQEYQKLWEVLTKKIHQLNDEVTIKIRHGFTNDEFVLRANNVSVNLCPLDAYSPEERRIVLREWLGGLIPRKKDQNIPPAGAQRYFVNMDITLIGNQHMDGVGVIANRLTLL